MSLTSAPKPQQKSHPTPDAPTTQKKPPAVEPAKQEKPAPVPPYLRDAPKKEEPKKSSEQTKPTSSKPVQAKLNVSEPGDAQEREADQVADAIASGSKDKKDVARKVATGISRRENSKDGIEVPPAVEARIDARRGSGAPLPADLRGEMENHFGTDLGAVRIHTDPEAAAAARAINAQAFTSGSDVYFDSNRYAPGQREGKHLMSHELTHYLQQRGQGGTAARKVQRNPNASAPSAPASTGTAATGNGVLKGDILEIPVVKIAGKQGAPDVTPFTMLKDTNFDGERPNDQTSKWDNAVSGKVNAKWSKKVQSDAGKGHAIPPKKQGQGVAPPSGKSKRYVYEVKGLAGSLVIGDEGAAPAGLLRPWWAESGEKAIFAVDHIRELQLGGQDEPDNYQLFETRANSRAGSRISKGIYEALAKAVPPTIQSAPTTGGLNWSDIATKLNTKGAKQAGQGTGANPQPGTPGTGAAPSAGTGTGTSPPAAGAAQQPALPTTGSGTPGATTPGATAPGATTPGATTPGSAGAGPKQPGPQKQALIEIRQNCHLSFLSVNQPQDIFCGGPVWTKGAIEGGVHLAQLEPMESKKVEELFGDGMKTIFPKPRCGTPLSYKDGTTPSKWGDYSITSLTDTQISFSVSTKGIVGTLDVALIADADEPDRIRSLAPGGGKLPKIQAKLMSPIDLDTFSFTENMTINASGMLTVDGIDLFRGASFGVDIVNGQLSFVASLSANDIKIPGPVKIQQCDFTLTANKDDVEATGQVNLAIGEFVTANLAVSGSAAKGITLSGSVVATDKEMFDAAGQLKYERSNGQSKLNGNASLKFIKKLPGLKPGAILKFGVSENNDITLGGQAELSIPGFKSANFNVTAKEGGNIDMAASLAYGGDNSIITDGQLNVNVAKNGGDWDLAGDGYLNAKIDGLADGRLKLSYAKGVLTGDLNAQMKKKMVDGTLNVHAKAGVGESEEPLKVWGDGTVNFTAAPWLKATVGLTLDEEGKLTAAGRVGLPGPVNLFDEKRYDKNLLSLAMPKIPIFGFSAAGINVGVFLSIDGKLDFTASVGPGQITTAEVGIKWSPDDEDATELDGEVAVQVPAYAGLRLTVDAGVGAGAAVVSVIGGLRVWGEMGARASVGSRVGIRWTPSQGVHLSAEAKAEAEAVLKLGAAGFIKVDVPIWGTVYDEQLDLAGIDIGSGLKIGAAMPIEYEPGKEFAADFSQLEITKPDISLDDVVSKLKAQIPNPLG